MTVDSGRTPPHAPANPLDGVPPVATPEGGITQAPQAPVPATPGAQNPAAVNPLPHVTPLPNPPRP